MSPDGLLLAVAVVEPLENLFGDVIEEEEEQGMAETPSETAVILVSAKTGECLFELSLPAGLLLGVGARCSKYLPHCPSFSKATVCCLSL